jgi:aminopeptidase-like protein
MEVELENIRRTAQALFPHSCGVVTPGNAQLFREIGRQLPAQIHRYQSGSEFNGWTVPNSWSVKQAEIRRDGKLLFDGTTHPLGVAALSKSFSGTMSWSELSKHIHTRLDRPHAHGYHCMWQYRPWERDWCLCVPHQQFKKWPKSGKFQINLVTEEKPGDMLVADCVIPGRLSETIVFNAHTCHPRQANDDIVGAAVCIEIFKQLAKQKNKYTYRLILGPEHLGTVFFLSRLTKKERKKFIGGYFLEMPGTGHPLKVASSFLGEQLVDRALRHAVKHSGDSHEFVPWRRGAGNDETVWEAPGYEIPFVEFSRCGDMFAPFNEYHTSEDTLDNVDWTRVKTFTKCVLEAIDIIEKDTCYRRRFEGLPCLSNPKYNLYIERPDPSVEKNLPLDSEKWGYLSDCFFRYLDGETTMLNIAERHGIKFESIHRYAEKLEAVGLVRSQNLKSSLGGLS